MGTPIAAGPQGKIAGAHTERLHREPSAAGVQLSAGRLLLKMRRSLEERHDLG
ncbi:MAG: hypothetical protein AB1486_16940 [Planctomycetota bacterium]